LVGGLTHYRARFVKLIAAASDGRLVTWADACIGDPSLF
jgi:hypothetical protein